MLGIIIVGFCILVSVCLLLAFQGMALLWTIKEMERINEALAARVVVLEQRLTLLKRPNPTYAEQEAEKILRESWPQE